jgi:beta-glucanase (GH16 family)
MFRDYVILSGVKQSLSSLSVCGLLIFGILSGWSPPIYAVTNLVFSDEFNGAGANVDTTKWGFDLGNSSTIAGGGWGNNELETYSSAAKNAFVSNGVLHIVALNDVGGGAPYSSARLHTLGHFSLTYGRIEVRARLPRLSPYWWPAIWMLVTN